MGLSDQTVRQMVPTTAGGDAVRVRIGNKFGETALRIGKAHVGVTRRSNAADLIAETGCQLRFGGEESVTIPPGGEIISDGVPFTVQPHQVIAVDLYFPDRNGPPQFSMNPIQAAYLASGDRSGVQSDEPYDTRLTLAYSKPYEVAAADAQVGPRTSVYVTALEVRNADAEGCIAAIGDSLTFGRWSQWLSRRLRGKLGDRAPSVVHLANSGQKLASDLFSSPSLPSRFEQDVLSVTGLSAVIVSIGFNDLGVPSEADFARIREGHPPSAPDDVTAAQMIDCYRQMISNAHEHAVRIFGCTVPPGNGGAWNPSQAAGLSSGDMLELWPDQTEHIRREVNAWIRESGAFDAVFDLAHILENRMDRSVKDPLFTDDGVHFNAGGWYEMADNIDLNRLLNPPHETVAVEADGRASDVLRRGPDQRGAL